MPRSSLLWNESSVGITKPWTSWITRRPWKCTGACPRIQHPTKDESCGLSMRQFCHCFIFLLICLTLICMNGFTNQFEPTSKRNQFFFKFKIFPGFRTTHKVRLRNWDIFLNILLPSVPSFPPRSHIEGGICVKMATQRFKQLFLGRDPTQNSNKKQIMQLTEAWIEFSYDKMLMGIKSQWLCHCDYFRIQEDLSTVSQGIVRQGPCPRCCPRRTARTWCLGRWRKWGASSAGPPPSATAGPPMSYTVPLACKDKSLKLCDCCSWCYGPMSKQIIQRLSKFCLSPFIGGSLNHQGPRCISPRLQLSCLKKVWRIKAPPPNINPGVLEICPNIKPPPALR